MNRNNWAHIFSNLVPWFSVVFLPITLDSCALLHMIYTLTANYNRYAYSLLFIPTIRSSNYMNFQVKNSLVMLIEMQKSKNPQMIEFAR